MSYRENPVSCICGLAVSYLLDNLFSHCINCFIAYISCSCVSDLYSDLNLCLDSLSPIFFYIISDRLSELLCFVPVRCDVSFSTAVK